MLSFRKLSNNECSNPKKRRLGTGIVIKPKSQDKNIEDLVYNSPDRCESPLPCNQVEFLFESNNHNIITSSPEITSHYISNSNNSIDSAQLLEFNNTLLSSVELSYNDESINQKNIDEFEGITAHMFESNVEINNVEENTKSGHETNLTNHGNYLNYQMEESFDINHSFQKLEQKHLNYQSEFFDSKDSFLLDIQENNLVNNKIHKSICSENSYYGLPLTTKNLFKSLRRIEKLYDWQEECLSLKAVSERRNLIYALPTSGGKTLPAEILMLKEVLIRKHNVLFILPFVAIVQEKVWSLSPFAVQLDFLVEEYAAGKGHIPPVKRRKKKSIYIATIEKGLALVRSLIELDRLSEIGLIVVDELHLIGEQSRGATLEMLLSTVLFTKLDIQIVGMSATIGNLSCLAEYLRAEVFERTFRPVQLTEYVKLDSVVYKITRGTDSVDLTVDREIACESQLGQTTDPDGVSALVAEICPEGSCLVFCPTKKNCENVAIMLASIQNEKMRGHRTVERRQLASSLRSEGGLSLANVVVRGIAYHHAGITNDERALIEQAFRSGVISVICCTSTLAAGVNLPAERVIVRAPRIGSGLISRGAYTQMIGRAGRAGVTKTGDSIIICNRSEWPELRDVLSGGVSPASSALQPAIADFLLSGVSLGLASTRDALRRFLDSTLLKVQCGTLGVCVDELCDDAIRALLETKALEMVEKKYSRNECDKINSLSGSSELAVSSLGKAAIKGCLSVDNAKRVLCEVSLASRSLVLTTSLHLLYLVTPHDAAGVKPQYNHYYTLYCGLNEECLRTAETLGITERTATRMMTGRATKYTPESVLCRFYVALILYDLWNEMPIHQVAEKYVVSRGTIQTIITSSVSKCISTSRAVATVPSLWPMSALLTELAPRLQHAAAPQLTVLMDLPNVRKARALQLYKAGYKRIEDIAKAPLESLTAAINHLSRTAAQHLVSAARMMLIEKVENLKAEAEDVMEELNA